MRILLLGDGLWAVHALNHLKTFCELPWAVGRRQETDSCFETACHSIALPFVQPADINSPSWIQRINKVAPDILLSVSYDQIFKPSFLDEITCPVINIHAGDPSRFRGRAILTWQLIEGHPSIDLCAMRVDEGIDTGQLLAKTNISMHDAPYYGEALERVSSAVPGLLAGLFAKYEEVGMAAFKTGLSQPSSSSTGIEARKYPRRRPGDEWLDWTCSSEILVRSVRALTEPNPFAAVMLGETRLSVVRASLSEGAPKVHDKPGTIIGLSLGSCCVKTIDGTLNFHELRDTSGLAFPLSKLHLGQCFTSPGNRRLQIVEQNLQSREAQQ